MPFLNELKWRGLLHQTAGDGIEAHLATPGRVAYAGFDPTSTSLTIGNYIPIKMLAHWQRAGHRPIVLMGGGTGLIGDPSGKTAERQLLSREQVQANVEAQQRVFERVLDFSGSWAAHIVDNADWLCRLGFVEVLRDVGKHFSVNQMIHRESVASRLENREQGISFTEFSYMILQAYDFVHLHRESNCTVQLGGSDQFGNIVSGIDLIRRMCGAESWGVTAPLVTRADGGKIGKTEQGAVWLTAEHTSPFAFHQYWLNTTDADVVRYLRWFTFLSRERIEELEAAHGAAPHERSAQRALADHMTELLHGSTELSRVQAAAAALFGGDVRELDDRTLREVFAEAPHSAGSRHELDGEGLDLVELLASTTLCTSKREAREFLGNGSIQLNGERVAAGRRVTAADLLHGRLVLLRRGKKHWHAVE
ncbi:MAG: tyrosine--tRNA ligase, partial [Phycisphaerales bacterium]|nr:tyrosine--tRNA ligase [Phycisphaerales bacterium]